MQLFARKHTVQKLLIEWNQEFESLKPFSLLFRLLVFALLLYGINLCQPGLPAVDQSVVH